MADETHDHTKEGNAWKRLKGLVWISDRPPNLYVQVPSCESIRPIGHPLGSHPLNGSSRLGEGEAESRTTTGRKENNHISIQFTHNHPCREDGEDEDLRCLWIVSSDDEEDGKVTHTDAVSATS
jgi:hypothetical protein